ncbi:pyridoxamine 5'-phosphate oxidase-related FMN- binding protein [Kribbella flavida DSM 17836]|uniref:Pyridoxamine 5'-phosphate oxidase-related FMN-binding protein n=1 Tax=Kribbella flavida (strain DSM 17836 / JCM 10339 / NBRC 14399) TaxID=479435 RepID=D2PKQ9_KRIFD|nr:TIGR03618 family F420-dependent PPOX class oxidoreductase [Kribbella flavida]ADB32376.1 pyridoxamine 5'-phosphate oxidase-related FMN- binding protein [Kribbella flavida DSM 17836]
MPTHERPEVTTRDDDSPARESSNPGPELPARLAREQNVWLCTLRPDGSPHVTPVWFVYMGSTWWIGSAERNRKVRNVERDPRVSLALEDGRNPVVAEGQARVHHSGFPADVVAAFARKYRGWDVTAAESAESGARVLIEIPVKRWLLEGRAQ